MVLPGRLGRIKRDQYSGLGRSWYRGYVKQEKRYRLNLIGRELQSSKAVQIAEALADRQPTSQTEQTYHAEPLPRVDSFPEEEGPWASHLIMLEILALGTFKRDFLFELPDV